MKGKIDIEKRCAHHSLFYSLFYSGYLVFSLGRIKAQLPEGYQGALSTLNTLFIVLLVGLVIFISFAFFLFGIVYGKLIERYRWNIKVIYLTMLILAPFSAYFINPLYNSGSQLDPVMAITTNILISCLFWFSFATTFYLRNKEYFLNTKKDDNKKEEATED